MKLRSYLSAFALVAAGSAPALADVASPPPPPSGGIQPAVSALPFVTLDRQDGGSTIDLEATYSFVASNGLLDGGTLLHFNLAGHYVDPVSHFGGYFNLPVGFISGNNQSATGIGSVELGGIYAAPISPDAALIAHVGLGLPTSPSSGDGDGDELFANYTRVNDLFMGLADTTTLRLGISPVIRSGNLFARADVGLDVILSHPGDNSESGRYIHLGVGAGVIQSGVALTAEISAAFIHGDNDDAGSDGSPTLVTGALSVRALTGQIHPYAAVVVPLDHDLQQLVHAAITVGVSGSLPH